MQLNTVIGENVLLTGLCAGEWALNIDNHIRPRKLFGQLIISLHGAKVRLHGLSSELSACGASQTPRVHIVGESFPKSRPPDHLEGI